MKVLGIESSCDETGIAIYDTKAGLLSQCVYSQIPLHAPFGGVVPELASRDHIQKTLPLIESVLDMSGLALSDLDGVAYTSGPGLAGALMVGAMIGRSLAFGLEIPAIGVHHMEGHLLTPLMEDPTISFPFLSLLVSGGHTLVVDVKGFGRYQILGESLDDAVGEAFDKTAKLLDLGYPGGPALARLATKGTPGRFKLPRPLTDRPGLDFSFSGLKTGVRRLIEQESPLSDQTKADIAYAFEEAATDTLMIKCQRALEHTGYKTLVIAGGVTANLSFREKLKNYCAREGVRLAVPSLALCGDNGAMISFVGAKRLEAGQHAELDVNIQARWELGSLAPF